MTDLPDPLTPPNCDLRGYEYMPLVGQRMFGSTFYDLALRNPRAGMAGIKLWWEAYTQCPAGSLPDDDYALARMADFGTDMKGWKAAKDVALHGFFKCSDGRLYNPTLATVAIKAFELRLKSDKKREGDRERLRLWRIANAKAKAGETPDEDGGNKPETPDETANETPPETPVKRVSSQVEGKGREEKESKNPPSLRSGSPTDRGQRLPADWQPDDDDAAHAVSLGLVAAVVAQQFRDYWHAKPGKDARKLDWHATWRNWCRTDAKRIAKHVNARLPSAVSPRKAASDAAMAEFLAGFEPEQPPVSPRILLQ